jgi:hypothetical protein
MILLPSKEPLFASREQRKDKYVVYYDNDGSPACCNFTATSNARICEVCGNACVQFVVDEYGKYTCSACGKFPRELLLH